ncbi:SDR family NAD(P)-dependent oxidoreductase [Actinomycetospora aeridis]|uniref:SDR family oxidoreductase n=1 Tax=Actinomycetospora aeridis TaxID=3129231 RepID=A0ABU8NDP8_9PSEU
MPTALITGATAGIGAAFARRLAADGHRLVLVARDEPRLDDLAGEMHERHGAPAEGKHEVLPADLATAEGRAVVEQRLRDGAAPVDMLVNNAGIGSVGTFWDTDAEALNAQFELGTTAVFRLTRAALEGMVERDRGAVLTVASFAGLLAGRNGASYTAAKTYAVSLSAEIAAELRGTGVQAMAVCPGWTHTELHQRSGSDCPEDSSAWWLEADEVVDTALRDLARGRTRSVPGRRYRLLLAAVDAMPHAFTRR